MKPIENSKIAGVSALSRITGNRPGGSEKPASRASVAEAGMAQRSRATLAGSSAPIDSERVATIRDAIRSGKYPLVPAQVADAMIAAGMFLNESPKTQEV